MSVEDVRSAFDDMMAGSATEAEVSEAIDKLAEPCVYSPVFHGSLTPGCQDVRYGVSPPVSASDGWKFCPYCGRAIEVWKAVPREDQLA